MIFTRDEAAAIRQGKLTATLVPTTSKLKADRTTPLRRRYQRHDADGTANGTATETVADTSPEGDRKTVVLTIISVDEIHVDDLKQQDAQACGYRTLTGLKDNWRQQHPRADIVKIVRFAVGDQRDRDRYLNWTGRGGGDYTGNRHRASDDAAALHDDVLAPITKLAHERHRARANDPLQKQRTEITRSLDEMEDILRRHPNRDVSRTIRALRHQLSSLDRKLKAA